MADEPELTHGAQGDWVEYLQQWLSALGFYNGAIDGDFGSVTHDAVVNAQQQYSIGEGGTVGPETWQMVNLARTANDARVEMVWADGTEDEVDVPEIGTGSSEVGA
jgi:peptidoglycan hydrolase-like protein with peptidoglycan-binding domain